MESYFHTHWAEPDKLDLRLQGLDMDAVYESFLRQIARGQGELWSVEWGVKENIQRQQRAAKLEKHIAALEKKVRNEKQPKKKFELVQEIKRLRGAIE